MKEIRDKRGALRWGGGHLFEQIVISARELARFFGDVKAVDGLSFEVGKGEIFGFLGHNGAGKTTTVRLLTGVLTPTAGSAQVLGLNPMSQGPALRARTGVLTETPSLEERLSGWENLRIYGDLYGVPESRLEGRVREMLDRFGLLDHADDRVGGYSTGMRQRLALARAFLHDPELIFLDEPTAALDPVAAKDVRQLIQEVAGAGGHTVFLCTHNLAEAQELCSRVAILEHGRLIAIGTPAELGERYGGAARLEIEVSPGTVDSALATLASQASLLKVQSDGSLLSITGASRDSIPELIQTLVSCGVRIYQVTPQRPTLEDVYFELHRMQEEKG
jgi:ABC-2 type transport system ATP-binding protein